MIKKPYDYKFFSYLSNFIYRSCRTKYLKKYELVNSLYDEFFDLTFNKDMISTYGTYVFMNAFWFVKYFIFSNSYTCVHTSLSLQNHL